MKPTSPTRFAGPALLPLAIVHTLLFVANIASAVLLRHGPSFGIRYDFNENMALKTQLDHTLRKGQADLNGLQMQLAVTF